MDEKALWQAVVRQTQKALNCGALKPIQTDQTILEDKGIPFSIRYVSSLELKHKEKAAIESQQHSINPFLPPERLLTVTSILDRHIAVLNKFNVFSNHLLIVTRKYEHQQTLLTDSDFAALWQCLRDDPSFGFYNSGETAGASQPHKHLQLVSLPLTQREPIPINKALTVLAETDRLQHIPVFSFDHCFYRFSGFNSLHSAVALTSRTYHAMLDNLGLSIANKNDEKRVAQPYNLLLSRDWMMLVPRMVEKFNGISINALAYAGSFFVRQKEDIDVIKKHGPLRLLQQCSGVEV